jgi:hypothetical protein
MRLTFSVTHQAMDGERAYEATVELPDKTPLETIEAHARTMLGILADQAGRDCEGGEDEDEPVIPQS